MNGRTPLFLTLLLIAVLATVLLVAQPYSYRGDSSYCKADTAPMSYFLNTVLHGDTATPALGPTKRDGRPGPLRP